MKRALICGVSGQDGAYLAELLLKKGYEVWGTSRDANISSFSYLRAFGIFERVHLVSMAVNDFRSVLQVLNRVQPDELYNLAGQSSVALSFEQPVETLESITTGTLNLLEVVRLTGLPLRFYNACSSECFGNTPEPANEETPFRPRSPYALAKAAAHWAVINYREAYGLHACSGILFNHESPIRPERFVTRKIVAAAVRISRGSEEKLKIGDISVVRDWGWAPEFVHAMWSMLQSRQPDDYVIATGESHSLEAFIRTAFELVRLDYRDYVEPDESLLRPSDISLGRADPAKAKRELGWAAKIKMHEVVSRMLKAEKSERPCKSRT